MVDTNYSASPIYDYLVSTGSEVFVCGSNPNDFLAKTAKNYINVDYSDINQMRAIIKSLAIDYVVPGCSDRSYLSSAALNADGRFFGLDSYEVTERLNNKEQFRALARQIGLPVPRVVSVAHVGDIWPLIVKPVDAFSGRGISVVHESARNTLPAAIQRAEEYSTSKACIIEEYVEGQLYSHSAFLAGGDIYTDFIVEEHGTANPFVVDTSWLADDFPTAMLNRIRKSVLLMAKKLNLCDGLVHTQFIASGSSYWLIEVTRRCPGDLYCELIERSTGFHYAEEFAKPFLNRANAVTCGINNRSFVLRHTISPKTESIFRALEFSVPVLIEKIVPLALAGDSLGPSPFGRAGLMFLRAQSQLELSTIVEIALKRELYSLT